MGWIDSGELAFLLFLALIMVLSDIVFSDRKKKEEEQGKKEDEKFKDWF